jgi:hypothetical protein
MIRDASEEITRGPRRGSREGWFVRSCAVVAVVKCAVARDGAREVVVAGRQRRRETELKREVVALCLFRSSPALGSDSRAANRNTV